eukprot:9494580-Alexandrium_andersonii.AAC.2
MPPEAVRDIQEAHSSHPRMRKSQPPMTAVELCSSHPSTRGTIGQEVSVTPTQDGLLRFRSMPPKRQFLFSPQEVHTSGAILRILGQLEIEQ